MILSFKVIQISLFFVIFVKFMSPQAPPRNELDRKFPYVSMFKSVTCENFNVTGYGYVKNCTVKPYSRNHSTLNFGYTFNKQVDRPFYVRILMLYKFGNIYREVYKTTIEVCSILDNIESQPVFKVYISAIKKTFGDLLHKCPYSGSGEFINITIDETETRNNILYPEGFFKVCVTFLKPADQPIARLCPVFYTKSPLKDSFGKK
ncbi:hypothetical protein ACKWTF_015197 [Chironomus riparius]